MPDIVHAQLTHTNAYLTQLIEQFARIDRHIENGETVTINMSDGDRSMSLTVSRDKVVERATPPQWPATGKAPTLADNGSLVAALTKSFSFDIGEAKSEDFRSVRFSHIFRTRQRRNQPSAPGRICAGRWSCPNRL
jgi:hypothetical protein